MDYSPRYATYLFSCGHKTHLNKFKRIEVIQSTLSDHNGIKLEINTWKIPKYLEIINMLLNNMHVKKDSREILKYLH